MDNKVRYNLGCGNELLPGYINCDFVNHPGIDVCCPVWRLRDKSYNFTSPDSVDEIRASHVLEHVPPALLNDTLKEWNRVLKKEGDLYIFCPNAALIFQDYLDNKISMEEASRLLFGEHDFEGNVHHLCFDRQRLNTLVISNGFGIVDCNGRPDAYRYELGVHARKL